MNKYLKEKGGSLSTSGVTVLAAVFEKYCNSMRITTAEELLHGIPIQVQIELDPGEQIVGSGGVYIYTATINSIKARVKPGTAQFVGAEEKYLDQIINGTEEADQIERRAKKRAEKLQAKKLEEANRFTGLELS